MTSLPHHLDRTIVIRASRDTVFSFFTDSSRFASWWGAGSSVDPRPGGRVAIRYPNGVEAGGEILDIAPPERIVFTYGYASGEMVPPGGSRVTIRLEAHPDGTVLHLRHEFAEVAARDHHVQGWRYQLSLFANVAADLANAGAADLVDRWFAAWGETNAAAREAALSAIVEPRVAYRDRFSLVDGLADLSPHIAAAQRFMPGVRVARASDVCHCQGALLVDWAAHAADGAARGQGTSVFLLSPAGRIASVVGFWK